MKTKKRDRNEEPEEEVKKPLQTEGKVTLDLTLDDIIKGIPGCAMLCPLARCGNRCVPGAYNCRVTHSALIVFFGSKRGYKSYPLPETVSGYTVKYDETGILVPFAYEITL